MEAISAITTSPARPDRCEPAAIWRMGKRAQKLRGNQNGRHHGRNASEASSAYSTGVMAAARVSPVVEIALASSTAPVGGSRTGTATRTGAGRAEERRSSAEMVRPSTARMYPTRAEERVLGVRRGPNQAPHQETTTSAGHPESRWSVRDRGGGPPHGNTMKASRIETPAPRSSAPLYDRPSGGTLPSGLGSRCPHHSKPC